MGNNIAPELWLTCHRDSTAFGKILNTNIGTEVAEHGFSMVTGFFTQSQWFTLCVDAASRIADFTCAEATGSV